LILTAGLGTRLRPLSSIRAKAAVPIAGQPLIRRIIRWLAEYDVRDIVVNLHHLPETITSSIGDGSDLAVTVRYSWEPRVLGSAGGPRRALSLLPEQDFLIINGDHLTNADVGAVMSNHRQTGALVTLAVVPNRWPDRYGGIVTDASGQVHGFVPRGSRTASYHFFGVQIAHPSAFAAVPFDEPAESFSGVYRALIASRSGSVRAFLCAPDFWDVGTPADYLDAALSIGKAEGFPTVQIGRRSHIDASAEITNSVLWDDVDVGAGAILDRCIVADNVKIPSGVSFQNCAIIQEGQKLGVSDLDPGASARRNITNG
jgi:NDP-sugar pyrophosphorylase family protein